MDYKIENKYNLCIICIVGIFVHLISEHAANSSLFSTAP